jgi:hypothetical protein
MNATYQSYLSLLILDTNAYSPKNSWIRSWTTDGMDRTFEVARQLSCFLLHMRKRLGRHRSNAAGPFRSHLIRTQRAQPARFNSAPQHQFSLIFQLHIMLVEMTQLKFTLSISNYRLFLSFLMHVLICIHIIFSINEIGTPSCPFVKKIVHI